MGDVVYGWTGGAEGSGLPFPIADQSSPNAARDIQALAERIVTDADNADLTGLPDTGQPLAFYGSGRPDTGYPELANVATGSTFTCTDPDTFGTGGNFGAAVWRKGARNWVCVEGRVTINLDLTPEPVVASTAHVRLVRNGTSAYCRFGFTGVRATNSAAGSPIHTDTIPSVWVPYVNPPGVVVQSSGSGGGQSYLGWVTPGYQCKVYHGGWVVGPSNVIQFSGPAYDHRWPEALPPGATPARTLEELRELIEAEADPEKLQQLRDELAALTGTRPGDDK